MKFWRVLPYNYDMEYQRVTTLRAMSGEVTTRAYATYKKDPNEGISRIIAAITDISGMAPTKVYLGYGSEDNPQWDRGYTYTRDVSVLGLLYRSDRGVLLVPPTGAGTLPLKLHKWRRGQQPTTKYGAYVVVTALHGYFATLTDEDLRHVNG